MNCRKCGSHEYSYVICDRSDCPNLPLRMLIEHDISCPRSQDEEGSVVLPPIDPELGAE